MITLITSLALAAEPSDLSVTSVGAQGVESMALGAGDVDLMLGQRLRWEVVDDTRVMIDGRFTVDPVGETTWETSRVRSLGVVYQGATASLSVGRSPLTYGGPRLVDGLQGELRPGGGAFAFGAWAGLVPDEFDTRPMLRPGVGPTVAVTGARGQASLLGELVLSPDGTLDRTGGLFEGRVTAGRVAELATRVDAVALDGAGNTGIADAAAFVRVRPSDELRFDAFYDAYSTLRYRTVSEVDPSVQRFADRIATLGVVDPFAAEALDPTLHHLVGAGGRWQGQGDGLRPLFGVAGRGRIHPDPLEQYARVGPMVGLGGLAGGRLELQADGNVLWLEGRTQGDAGLTAVVDILPDAIATLDGSARLLFDPIQYGGGFGQYADLFVDLILPSSTVIAAGGSWTREPSDVIGTDVGLAAFLRLQQWIRPGGSGQQRELRPVAAREAPEREAREAPADEAEAP